MRFIFILLFAASTQVVTLAQNQDYVITLRKDTLYGDATITNYRGQQILLKNGKDKVTFKVYQIRQLVMKERTYHPLKIRDQYQLGLLKKRGYLSYYLFSDDPSSSIKPFEVPLLVKNTGEQLEVSKLVFKKYTSKFLEDCNTVTSKFEAKEYAGRKDLEQIIDDYNQCIASRTTTIEQQIVEEKNNTSKIDEVGKLKIMVNSSSVIKDKDVVLEMIDDVESRIKEGKSLPDYLINALKEKLAGNKGLLEKIESIVN